MCVRERESGCESVSNNDTTDIVLTCEKTRSVSSVCFAATAEEIAVGSDLSVVFQKRVSSIAS